MGNTRSKKSRSVKPRRQKKGGQLGTVSHRRRDLETFARSEALYRYVFDNANDAIFIHDLAGHFLQVNQIACQQLGYTRDELLHMRVQELDTPEIAERFDESMSVFMQKGSIVAETCHVRKDGSCIPVEVGARLIEYHGQPAVLTVARDLSERKRLEEELHNRNRELAIREERDRLGRELHDGVGQVLGYIGVKTAAIGELLRHGQIEEAEQSLVELNQVAQEAYGDVRESILGLRSTVAVSGGLEPILREYLQRYQREWHINTTLDILNQAPTRLAPAAEIQLLRVIQEALTNVRKHAQAQNTWIQFDQTDDTVVVRVKDDGVGFDPNRPQKERFGLQTMRERIESIGGTVSIESSPNAGTTIQVNLPLGQVRESSK
jgi:PAS domain S-box-containing protein